jgi:hypothetical protein
MKMKLCYQVGLKTLVICFKGVDSIKDIWRFSVGSNVLKSARFFPGNGDRFSFNGGWLEGSFAVALNYAGSQVLLGIETSSLSV